MNKLKNIIPLSPISLEAIRKKVGEKCADVIGIDQVDHEFGMGVIDGRTSCVWRGDRTRLTFMEVGKDMVIQVGHGPDPFCP